MSSKIDILCLTLLISVAFGCSKVADAQQANEDGTSWRLVGPNLNPDLIQELKTSFPKITTQRMLVDFIKEINRISAMSQVEVRQDEKGFVFNINSAQILSDIEVTGANLRVRRAIRQKLLSHVLKVDSPTLRTQLLQVVALELQGLGYPQSEVRINATQININDSEYEFNIKLGKPCIIHDVRAIQFDFSLLKEFPLSVGDLCDVNLIKREVDTFKDKLRNQGFRSHTVDLNDVRYYPQTNSAEVLLGGELGKKIEIQIDNRDGIGFLKSLFLDDIHADIESFDLGSNDIKIELENRYRGEGYLDVEVYGPSISKIKENEE